MDPGRGAKGNLPTVGARPSGATERRELRPIVWTPHRGAEAATGL